MAIQLPFSKLSSWQQMAFACTLLERMVPNYVMFSQAADFGDSNLLKNQLALLWQRLDKSQKVKINVDAQITKLELQIPEPEDFDFFGVYPALDCTMAMLSALQSVSSNDGEELANVSKLSEGSVRHYLELVFAEQGHDEVSEEMLREHPLLQWEIATQNEVFDYLKKAPENGKTIKHLKALAREEGVSNLGIEF